MTNHQRKMRDLESSVKALFAASGGMAAKAGSRNSEADLSRIQVIHDMAGQVHDHAAQLGARCVEGSAAEERTESPAVERQEEMPKLNDRHMLMAAAVAAALDDDER